ncbi:Replication initiator protein A (RepA) N-terminus [Oribacterium sp. KHPX15]|uniref:replication initiator protein A n=1 Tax=Oribacterium sp. KHPX15 TaxID=1855342 RepID=UPI000898A3ED|nr:replication initiator protein A [Oribacterium sp. KHPX15]SEA18601.1 Replication initiator protein A (RepA) N-terminus [Oribacterium sp. KHPX15]
MNLRFIKREEAEKYSFIRIPKFLMTGEFFSDLSSPSKIMYGLMIDKMGASLKNKWLDEEGRVYIVYPVTEIQADMNISKRKTLDCLSELEAVGLIEKRKRGGGLPSIIYVKNFTSASAI